MRGEAPELPCCPRRAVRTLAGRVQVVRRAGRAEQGSEAIGLIDRRKGPVETGQLGAGQGSERRRGAGGDGLEMRRSKAQEAGLLNGHGS